MKESRLFVLLTALVTLIGVSQACSCIQPTLDDSFERNQGAARIIVGKEILLPKPEPNDEPVLFLPFEDRYFEATVVQVFKGCALKESGLPVVIRTAANGGLCGLGLSPGSEYLLFGGVDNGSEIPGLDKEQEVTILSAFLCSFQVQWKNLSEDQKWVLGEQSLC